MTGCLAGVSDCSHKPRAQRPARPNVGLNSPGVRSLVYDAVDRPRRGHRKRFETTSRDAPRRRESCEKNRGHERNDLGKTRCRGKLGAG